MEPTPHALELVGPLRHALGIIRSTLSSAPQFDPQRSSQVFRICSGDDLELTLLPRLLAHLKEHAPNINIEMIGIGGRAEAGLASAQIDLYLGVWFKLPRHLHHHVLRNETFVCIARHGHPEIKTRLTMKRNLEAGHVLVAPSERPECC